VYYRGKLVEEFYPTVNVSYQPYPPGQEITVTAFSSTKSGLTIEFSPPVLVEYDETFQMVEVFKIES